jgi:hypothetical protein
LALEKGQQNFALGLSDIMVKEEPLMLHLKLVNAGFGILPKAILSRTFSVIHLTFKWRLHVHLNQFTKRQQGMFLYANSSAHNALVV